MAAANADAAVTEPSAVEHSTDADLPKSVVQRLVRAKAIQMIEAATKPGAPATAEKKPLNVQISKDALLAFSEAGKVFINYLASTANDIAKENKRVTMSANDVLKALEDLEFAEFVEPLQQYLEAHKATLKERPTKKKEGGSTSKKRKAEIHAVAEETTAATEKAVPQPSPVPLAPLQQEAAGQPEAAA